MVEELDSGAAPDTAGLLETALPDGERVFCTHELEVASVHRQVRGYLQHGIRIEAGATVFDVGANIGLFTRLAHRTCGGDVRVLAFEPIPATLRALRANVARLGSARIEVFGCALGRQAGTLEFAYYPDFTVASTAYGDDQDELRAQLRASFLRNLDVAPPPVNRLRYLPPFLRGLVLDWKMGPAFVSERVRCPVRTLSEIVRERGIRSIDLLKVDAEKSELDVLLGIEEADWSRVRQVVLEIHDLDGRLDRIRRLLESHGLSRIEIEQERILRNSTIFTMFARR